jgi:hypothetical protein
MPYQSCSNRFLSTNRCRSFLRALVLPWLVGLSAAHAQSFYFEKDFDDEEKPWQEIAVQIPAAPKKENLQSFYVGPTTSHTFSIDTASLSIGDDRVVRYILHVKTAGGAESVSYEGIRCQTYEKKTYAFGQRDGSWTRARRDKWEPITGTITNRYQAALAKDYFCDHQTVSGSVREIVARMRTGQRQQDDRMHNPN